MLRYYGWQADEQSESYFSVKNVYNCECRILHITKNNNKLYLFNYPSLLQKRATQSIIISGSFHHLNEPFQSIPSSASKLLPSIYSELIQDVHQEPA